MKRLGFYIIIFTSIILYNCERDLNVFSKKQDIELGLQMKEQIESSPDFNVLAPGDYPQAYNHLYRIRDEILENAEDIKFKDEFPWEVYIIDDDVLNAFACPGGYMYFYTGLINFLDDEAQFAGVMAHEMAHVDFRHTTSQLTKKYSYDFMVGLIFGKSETAMDSILRGVVGGVTFLKFGRDDEYQADEYAVKYLSDTKYNPLGASEFFEKLLEEEMTSGSTPVFLRTHPPEGDRVEAMKDVWLGIDSPEGGPYVTDFESFKSTLP